MPPSLSLRLPVRRRAAAVLAMLACAAGAVLATSAPAHAATVGSSDPQASVWTTTASPGGVTVAGLAYDPDAPTENLWVAAIEDGNQRLAFTLTNVAAPWIASHLHTGPTPRFSLYVPLPTGRHTVCLIARNIGAGAETVMNCFLTPYGQRPTPAVAANHNPVGGFLVAIAHPSSARLIGWADDPDDPARNGLVVFYVDGSPVSTTNTTAYAGPTPAGRGAQSGLDLGVGLSSGTHEICMWAVNVGIGSNSLLGCRTLDTRVGTAAPVRAPANFGANVVAEAKKHIGQPYVWATEGPRTFDCSGLVLYSYEKFGVTPPRVSRDQFHAARLIPASHAQPGDLVFYHDSEGLVYHVGIYLGPAMTVAAIDPEEGVNYQHIWDTTGATYGSFTHT